MIVGCSRFSGTQWLEQKLRQPGVEDALRLALAEAVRDKAPGRAYGIPLESLPEEIRRLRPSGAQVEVAQVEGESSLTVFFGGGHGHWGIIVGQERYELPLKRDGEYGVQVRWANDIWLFEGD